MVWHEVGGILGLIIGGAILLGALSSNSQLNNVLHTSFTGVSGLIDATTAPVRPA